MHTFKHEENISDGGNEQFRVDKITMFSVDGEEMGYLKLSYIPDELNFYDFLDLKGHRFHPEKYGVDRVRVDSDFSKFVDEKRRSQTAYTLAQISRVYRWGDSNDLAEQSKTVVDFYKFLLDTELLQAVKKEYDAMYKMYTENFVDEPFVDYIRIHDAFQGKKNSIFLYLEAARWLKERNMRLRLSGVAMDSAMAVRRVMLNEGLLDTGKVRWYNKTETAYYVK